MCASVRLGVSYLSFSSGCADVRDHRQRSSLDPHVICGVATSVHGGDAPVNQWTIMVTRGMSLALRAKTPDAEDFMLALLNRWMADRGVRVARVEAFYGRAHPATAETSVFRAPCVEYH